MTKQKKMKNVLSQRDMVGNSTGFFGVFFSLNDII